MIKRKKNIFLIQCTIFFVATAVLYSTYSDKNKRSESFIKIETETNSNTNSFTDIEYSGLVSASILTNTSVSSFLSR